MPHHTTAKPKYTVHRHSTNVWKILCKKWCGLLCVTWISDYLSVYTTLTNAHGWKTWELDRNSPQKTISFTIAYCSCRCEPCWPCWPCCCCCFELLLLRLPLADVQSLSVVTLLATINKQTAIRLIGDRWSLMVDCWSVALMTLINAAKRTKYEA